jgi:hypothetical protein
VYIKQWIAWFLVKLLLGYFEVTGKLLFYGLVTASNFYKEVLAPRHCCVSGLVTAQVTAGNLFKVTIRRL